MTCNVNSINPDGTITMDQYWQNDVKDKFILHPDQEIPVGNYSLYLVCYYNTDTNTKY